MSPQNLEKLYGQNRYGCFLKWSYPQNTRKSHGCWVPPFRETPISQDINNSIKKHTSLQPSETDHLRAARQEMSHNLTRKFFQNPHTWPTNPQQHRVWNLKSSGKRRCNSGFSGIYSSIEMWTYWLDNKDAEDGILGTCSIQSPFQAKQPEFGSLTFPSGVDPPSGNWWEDGSKIQAFFSTELHSMQGPLPCHCAGYRVMVMVVSRGWRVRFRSRSRRCKCSDNLFPTKHCGSHRIQGTSRTKAKRGPGHSHHPSKSSKAPGSYLTSTKNIRYKSNHTKIYGFNPEKHTHPKHSLIFTIFPKVVLKEWLPPKMH